MKRFSVPPFEVSVQPVDGTGADGEDETSLEFNVVGGDQALAFAIFKSEFASVEESRLVTDPQSGAIPLLVIEWAADYARAHL